MERTIQIANTKTQRRYSIETSATTLGELKAQMTAQGIDYSGMTFTEGISKTQLLSDDSLLPTNVMYKGQPTNNLVMLLTNTNKQIASGSVTVSDRSRKSAYMIIKEMGKEAMDEIKDIYGKNYTQVTTDNLWQYIDDNSEEVEEPEEPKNPKAKEVKEAPHAELVEWCYTGIKAMIKNNLMYLDDVAVLNDLLTELYARLKETQPTITDSDIDDIIANF